MLTSAIQFIKENGRLSFALFLAAVLTAAPFLKAGLIIMDDLVYQLKASEGFGVYMQWGVDLSIRQGRSLSVPFLLFRYVALTLTKDGALYNVLTIFLSYGLLGAFLARLTGSLKTGMLTVALALAFTPNGWDHTPFVAFHGVYGTAFSLFLISVLWFYEYQQDGKRGKLYGAMFAYLLALFTYETFVVYIAGYFLLAWQAAGGTGRLRFKETLRRAAE